MKFVNIDLIISENIALLKTVGFWTGERKLSSRTIIIVSWMMCILPFYMVIPQVSIASIRFMHLKVEVMLETILANVYSTCEQHKTHN